MDAGALGRAARRHSGKAIAIVAAGVAATAVFTASASATSSGGATLRLTAKAAATVFITPCRTCVTSVPAGIHTGAVANQYGILIGGRGTRAGHFALHRRRNTAGFQHQQPDFQRAEDRVLSFERLHTRAG